MPRIALIDGATGFVGSNLAASMSEAGRRVVALVRKDPDEARAAIEDAVVRRGRRDSLETLEIVQFDLERDDLGLADGTPMLGDEPVDYWHLAANVNFRPGNQDLVLGVNVGGTRRTLDWCIANLPEGSRYHFASTAYVCGLDGYQPVERWLDVEPPSHFRNFYEYSKRVAELDARTAMTERGLSATIHRLGQIVGDSETGNATTDYGLYNLVRAVWAVARRRPGEHVRIEGDPAANLHLVPIDACVDWMTAIADATTRPDVPIFHVVDSAPVASSRIAEAIGRHLSLTVEIAPPEAFVAHPATLLERIVAARISYTGDYLAQPFTFGRAHLEQLIGSGPAALTDASLQRIIGSLIESLERGAREVAIPTRA